MTKKTTKKTTKKEKQTKNVNDDDNIQEELSETSPNAENEIHVETQEHEKYDNSASDVEVQEEKGHDLDTFNKNNNVLDFPAIDKKCKFKQYTYKNYTKRFLFTEKDELAIYDDYKLAKKTNDKWGCKILKIEENAVTYYLIYK